MSNLINSVPSDMLHGVYISGSDIFINSGFKNELSIRSFLSLAEKINRNINVSYLSLQEITDLKQRASEDSEMISSFANVKNSDVEDYAIELFKSAESKSASDIHILYEIDEATILFREGDGDVIPQKNIDPKFCMRLMSVIFQTMGDASNAPTFVTNSRLDAKINNPKYLPKRVHGIRIHSEPLDCKLGSGCKMVLRLLNEIVLGDEPLDKILAASGYSKQSVDDIMQMTMSPGLCIVAGPTGSGKSTQIAKIIGKMKKDVFPYKEFVSIEDPPEYPIPQVRQVAITETDPLKKSQAMLDALSGALRSDPDVLILGEIRIPEAASIAINAVNTGHGLWSTVHASSSFGVITRLEGLLAKDKVYDLETLCDPSVLSGIIYQRLIPKLCDHCKINLVEHIKKTGGKTNKITKKVLEDLKALIPDKLNNVYLSGGGCSHCTRGHIGRIVAAETVICDEPLLDFIKNREKTRAVEYWKRDLHGKTYIEHALEHISNGLCDPLETTISLKANLR